MNDQKQTNKLYSNYVNSNNLMKDSELNIKKSKNSSKK